MKIDWKHLAGTQGYKSLKDCYIQDLRKKERSKDELLRIFNFVICRAKHCAHHTGKSIEKILNEWEEKRGYWWVSYYDGGYRRPKFNLKSLGKKESNKVKPRWNSERKKRGY